MERFIAYTKPDRAIKYICINQMFKKITKNPIFQSFIAYIFYLYIKFVFYTSKWEYINLSSEDKEYIHRPSIYSFWHGRMFIMPMANPNNFKMNVLISDHRDGILIAKVMQNFSFNQIVGSTNRQSMKALKEVVLKIKNGENVSITPDGPRGPLMKINSNIVAIAKMANCVIMPITYSVKRKKIFNSWDKFYLPYPFNRGHIIIGKALKVEEGSDLTLLKIELEKEMNDITWQADNFYK